MASEQQSRPTVDVVVPPPEDWREAVCRRPVRAGGPVDADAWNEIVRARTERRCTSS
ncbi:hypothetical protein [Actinomycetospora sp. CA-084318]|uniref:hypothetical protein n=1 Tax=Actinomycetospora sp. CA-084318 TaxID=3239892 RepID=UPI003D95830C